MLFVLDFFVVPDRDDCILLNIDAPYRHAFSPCCQVFDVLFNLFRAPELLLGAKQYSTTIDMWSLGCIMAELLSKEPLFNGKTEVDQLDKVN